LNVLGVPTVTVVTPSYNAESFIGRTIQSVLDQTWQDWELLVVDDCSKDATRDVVATYAAKDARIRLIALKKNNGAPAAPRNIGVSEARGRWIAFLDADDIWHPEKLSVQLLLAETKSASFISSQMKDFEDDSSLRFTSVTNALAERLTFLGQRIKIRIPTSSVLVARDVMMKFPFREDLRYKAVEDYHCWLRMLASGVAHWKVQYPLLNYRISSGQISGSKLKQLEKVYMVHREFPDTALYQAIFFTFTHALGGFYYRIIRKGL